MCGITGFNWEDKKLLKKMNEAIIHRGPDDEGLFSTEEISLGSRRLAIIDLSPAARQPISNEEGTIWITYNGETYNFRKIREELEKKGHTFVSQSDTETIIHGYEEYGINILKKMNGMFAFALYDSSNHALYLARDRFGIKPLYYYSKDGKLIFCSEIKGILLHAIEKLSNENVIFDYLLYGLHDHTESTFFQDIYRVMPGTYVKVDLRRNTLQKKQWYSIVRGESTCNLQDIRDAFFRSVSYRLISDVPVGSCLSGGIDSSSIVCAMKELTKRSGPYINTFSAIFPHNPIDESDYINLVVDFTGVNSKTIEPTIDELMVQLCDLIKTQEEPFLGTSIFAQYQVMKLAKEAKMKVLLDGQGGDELFAGYLNYFTDYFAELFRRIQWVCLLREISYYVALYQNFSPPLHALSSFIRSIVPMRDSRPSWMKKSFYERYSQPRTYPQSLNERLEESITYSTLPGLLRYEDKNAMRWSVETRLPFLDHEFVEKALFIPSSYKIRKGITKFIFREALKSLIPEKIRNRSDKIGFSTPESEWFNTPSFREYIDGILDSDSFKRRNFWNWKKINDAYTQFKKSSRGTTRVIWRWINLELWLRMFIDNQ